MNTLAQKLWPRARPTDYVQAAAYGYTQHVTENKATHTHSLLSSYAGRVRISLSYNHNNYRGCAFKAGVTCFRIAIPFSYPTHLFVNGFDKGRPLIDR